jgi:hypothetical protein
MPRVYTTLLKVTRIRLRIIAIDCASFTSVCVAVAEAILWRQHGSERIDPWRRGDDGSADPGGQPLTNTNSVLPLAGFSAREAEFLDWFPKFSPPCSPSRRVAIALSSAGVPQAVKGS